MDKALTAISVKATHRLLNTFRQLRDRGLNMK